MAAILAVNRLLVLLLRTSLHQILVVGWVWVAAILAFPVPVIQALGRVAADNSPQAWRMLLKAVLRPAPPQLRPPAFAGMPVHNPAVQPVAAR